MFKCITGIFSYSLKKKIHQVLFSFFYFSRLQFITSKVGWNLCLYYFELISVLIIIINCTTSTLGAFLELHIFLGRYIPCAKVAHKDTI